MGKLEVNKKIVYNVLVLDASGSMFSMVDEVVDGVNKVLKTMKRNQKKRSDTEHRLIFTEFAGFGQFKIYADGEKITDVGRYKDYKTGGMTALYDAIGHTFDLIPKDADNVFFTIFTDGAENNSKEFTVKEVKKLIKSARKKDWSVLFMGADEASIEQAKTMGIQTANMTRRANTKSGTQSAFNVYSEASSFYGEQVGTASFNGQDVLTDVNTNLEDIQKVKKDA